MSKHKVLITQSPFPSNGDKAISILEKNGISYDFNPHGRIMNEQEMLKINSQYDIILSGTSPITKNVINHFNKLKLIARAGIGFDNIDLITAKERNIKITYTPDGPTNAVAEFTLGLIINGLKGITITDFRMKQSIWEKVFSKSLTNSTIGIIGVNRIGKKVIEFLVPFNPRIIAHDIKPDLTFDPPIEILWKTKEEVLQLSDVITLHIPLSNTTKNYLNKNELMQMKDDSILINTSRGGIINENALFTELKKGRFKCVALDVFTKEPYDGPLKDFSNVILTSHMASATYDSIENMEVGAVDEIIRFINNQTLINQID